VKPLVLALCVGGLGGLMLGERDEVVLPDPWFSEAVRGMRGGDLVRALAAVQTRLDAAPGDAAASLMLAQLRARYACAQTIDTAEHAAANGNRGTAIAVFRDVKRDCPQYEYALARLNQLGE